MPKPKPIKHSIKLGKAELDGHNSASNNKGQLSFPSYSCATSLNSQNKITKNRPDLSLLAHSCPVVYLSSVNPNPVSERDFPPVRKSLTEKKVPAQESLLHQWKDYLPGVSVRNSPGTPTLIANPLAPDPVMYSPRHGVEITPTMTKVTPGVSNQPPVTKAPLSANSSQPHTPSLTLMDCPCEVFPNKVWSSARSAQHLTVKLVHFFLGGRKYKWDVHFIPQCTALPLPT